MKRILLCGYIYETNYGDPIIFNCVKNIYNEYLKEKNVEYCIDELDLKGRVGKGKFIKIDKNILYYFRNFIRLMLRICAKICKKIHFNILFNYIDGITWNFTNTKVIYKKNFINKIKESDLIVFVGGGIVKYKYQNFYNNIDFITKYAEKYDKTVYLNAVGVEGYDSKNCKCRKLKKALNRTCVKMITTRDDLESLKKYIGREGIITKGISDPAVNTSKIYGIKKDSNSETIGLCVCRDKLFIDNDINYNSKQLLELWKNIINELEKNNMKWKIYTNGTPSDNEFAFKLLKFLNISDNEKTIKIPQNDTELVETISTFKGVIATRLHSCIVSFSLGVPAVGLVWNDKLKFFGNAINYPERFIETTNFDAKYIVETLKKALAENYKKADDEYKNSSIEAIHFTVDEFLLKVRG